MNDSQSLILTLGEITRLWFLILPTTKEDEDDLTCENWGLNSTSDQLK